MLQYPCLQDMLLIMFTLTLAIALDRMTGYACIISLACSLLCSKDPDHLYFMHISLLLCSLEQTEQTAGTPGMKYKAAHAEVKACSLTAWLETPGQSLEKHSRAGRDLLIGSLSESYVSMMWLLH